MTNAAIAISIILAIATLGTLLGVRAGAGRRMNLEEWSVAGRSFGVIFIWLLMAGELYTTFAFLGAAGWVYSRGAPALYILAYITLGYVTSFFFLPQLWQVGRTHGLQTQADFFRWRYGKNWLAVIVSITGVLFLVPYLQLQLVGLGIIVQVASFGAISRSSSMICATALIAFFVFAGGMRAVAWVSVLKDFLMLVAAAAIGLYVPYHYFGGVTPMFHSLVISHSASLVLPGTTKTMNHGWFMSTVLLSAFGFYMWPHTFATAFTAKNAEVLRRNAAITPLYTLSLLFIFFAGFAALLQLPKLTNGDMSLLLLARSTFPAWFLGVVGGAGALTAMVPAAIILLTASTLMAKNVARPLLSREMSEDAMARIAKGIVIALSLFSLSLALHSSATLVALLLLGYAGVSQFFPGVILGLFWRGANVYGIAAGLIAGVGCATALFLARQQPLHLNEGFIGLAANAIVAVIVSLITNRWSPVRQTEDCSASSAR